MARGKRREKLLRMYRTMVTIRAVEDTLADSVSKNEIGCPVHLYSGEEAVATGVCDTLRPEDWVYSSHRSHGHYLAKGGDLYGLMAEVFCREEGCSGGRGGSMHLSEPGAGLPGSSAIVAGSISLAVGAALAFSLKKKDNVAVTFFGDGALGEGVIYESMNFAALYSLPVIFVCENNLYSTHMPISKCLATTKITPRAEAIGVPSITIDGNDVVKVERTASRLIAKARAGDGPAFLECLTYRHRGHVGPNYDLDKGLRPKEEFDFWLKRCPICRFEKDLVDSKEATPEELKAIRSEIEKQVAEAKARAMACGWPKGEDETGFRGVFRRSPT
ncbi:MAG: thiamine pyrophosphate-dependent dehydrogenase E1 component subunit alpha [Methanomassiliicoccales archaeon]|nr:thiamine pyrophosphate-dependent dehydrogenase E1 component subunit alpha [Methanomassiliicoccales archaeon]